MLNVGNKVRHIVTNKVGKIIAFTDVEGYVKVVWDEDMSSFIYPCFQLELI